MYTHVQVHVWVDVHVEDETQPDDVPDRTADITFPLIIRWHDYSGGAASRLGIHVLTTEYLVSYI